jgi:hypothetical protein
MNLSNNTRSFICFKIYRQRDKFQNPCARKCEQRKKEEEEAAYKSIAFGSSSGLVGDDNSLQDLAKLFKIFLHGLLLRLPTPKPSLQQTPWCKWYRQTALPN